jgi:hypothetical protein
MRKKFFKPGGGRDPAIRRREARITHHAASRGNPDKIRKNLASVSNNNLTPLWASDKTTA